MKISKKQTNKKKNQKNTISEGTAPRSPRPPGGTYHGLLDLVVDGYHARTGGAAGDTERSARGALAAARGRGSGAGCGMLRPRGQRHPPARGAYLPTVEPQGGAVGAQQGREERNGEMPQLINS